jgi:hypothetical protein
MRFSFFGWLRAKTHESIMAGFADALDELDEGENADLDALRKRLAAAVPQKQLPAADEGEPGGKKRKAG